MRLPILSSKIGRIPLNEGLFRQPRLVYKQTEGSPNTPFGVPRTTSADYDTPHEKVKFQPFRPDKRNDSNLQACGNEPPGEAFLSYLVVHRTK